MALGNFRGLDFLRVANETLAQFGITGLFGSDGIEAIRNTEWGKKYLWAVRFSRPTPPSPFERYFPASDIEINDGEIEQLVFEQGQGSYKAPSKSTTRSLSITFYDDSRATLHKWMRDWIKLDILNNDQFMSCMLDDHAPVATRLVEFAEGNRVWPTREIEFFRLDENWEPVVGTERRLTIYPESALQLDGSSQSELNVINLTFAIVGESTNVGREGNNDSFLKKAKSTAARVLNRFT